MRIYYFLLFILIVSTVEAQMDTIHLSDVIVSDPRLKNQSKTQQVLILNDSVITKNSNSLTDLLNLNSSIYFKENGVGMVSSPSFRGTTAQQTSVLWNGISINSRFLGQSDFNSGTGINYDEIAIKPGGGSVIYGSGAIGGSVHLNNNLKFRKGLGVDLLAKYGSFNTLGLVGKFSNSNDRLSYNLSYARNSSDNDFEIESKNYINRNGQFWNNTFDGSLGYKLDARNQFSLFLQAYQDERHFAIVEEYATKTKYENQNFRGLLTWENRWNRLNSNFKLAYLNEDFKFYDRLEDNPTSHGKLNSFIGKYDGTYKINNQLNTSFLAEYTIDRANGDGNGIMNPQRNTLNLAFLMSHQLFNKLYYEAGIRTEFTEDYESPLLYSFGVNYSPSKFYEAKFNISKNYRVPSFNDLYWEPGGNLDLKAENSLQFELGQNFTWKKNTLGVNLYYNDISDMIRWVPMNGFVWSPMNTDEVISKGVEVYTHLQKSFANHHLQLNANYSYTVSRNKATEKQLSYVPYHKANVALTHAYKDFSWFLQGMYVGDVFSTTDESEMFKIDKYQVWNAGVNYEFGSNYRINLGFKVNNLFNYYYQPLLYRPMPLRNYGLQVKINL